MSGILMNPTGLAVTISNTEYGELQQHLEILRADDTSAVEAVLEGALHCCDFDKIERKLGKESDRLTVQAVLASVVFFVMANNQFDIEGAGALIQAHGNPAYAEALENEEMKFLRDALAAYRMGGWFPGWLELQLAAIAGETLDPEVRYPSPSKIMGTLIEDAEVFEKRAESAREMVEMRPDLFAPSTPVAVIEPPAEPAKPAKKQKAA